METTS
jgi:hypothetical protein